MIQPCLKIKYQLWYSEEEVYIVQKFSILKKWEQIKPYFKWMFHRNFSQNGFYPGLPLLEAKQKKNPLFKDLA